jgi:hypothetical protein
LAVITISNVLGLKESKSDTLTEKKGGLVPVGISPPVKVMSEGETRVPVNPFWFEGVVNAAPAAFAAAGKAKESSLMALSGPGGAEFDNESKTVCTSGWPGFPEVIVTKEAESLENFGPVAARLKKAGGAT